MRGRPHKNLFSGKGLFHDDFGCLAALTTDVEAVFGIGNADALEVVVFDGSV